MKFLSALLIFALLTIIPILSYPSSSFAAQSIPKKTKESPSSAPPPPPPPSPPSSYLTAYFPTPFVRCYTYNNKMHDCLRLCTECAYCNSTGKCSRDVPGEHCGWIYPDPVNHPEERVEDFYWIPQRCDKSRRRWKLAYEILLWTFAAVCSLFFLACLVALFANLLLVAWRRAHYRDDELFDDLDPSSRSNLTRNRRKPSSFFFFSSSFPRRYKSTNLGHLGLRRDVERQQQKKQNPAAPSASVRTVATSPQHPTNPEPTSPPLVDENSNLLGYQ